MPPGSLCGKFVEMVGLEVEVEVEGKVLVLVEVIAFRTKD